MTQLSEHSSLDIPPCSIELEESILGAILLDPGAIAAVEKLPTEAFSISAHQQIFRVMQELHQKTLLPDLLTVVSALSEKGILKQVGGKAKLASLLDRTVHSYHIQQHASLLLKKYYRRTLSDRLVSIARLAQIEPNISSAVSQIQSLLEKIQTVTSDSLVGGDTCILDPASFSTTVTTVIRILELGLSEWEEQASFDTVRLQSGLSKESFSALVASLRCQSDEVTSADEEQLSQLFECKNTTLDFKRVLPHMADDLLHDASVLNIEAIMLWQYLLPAILSLVGKKVNLDVRSHIIPAIAWTCCVAESGTGKSRAEGLILSALKAWQQQESERFKNELLEYKQSQSKKDDSGEQFNLPNAERKFLFDVATIQAIMKRLSEQGQNGSLWARDEIAGLFKSLNQFSAKGEGEGLECLLPMWDGVSNWVDRVLHEDSYYLANSRLSIAGGIQPGVFRKIFADADDAQGIQARFLFALPKVLPAKRVEGYCHLSDKLPAFYSWIDTQFPAGNVQLSAAANARYTALYESIGRRAELATKPAHRAWMRKLSGQLLRIALALHVIECYYDPGRPRHELQVDTLNRAADFCRYYSCVFQVVQQTVSDSDSIVDILNKIWDMAATSPNGLVVRDAYRSIKALSRRAGELGRSVAAYTTDLYYQLEKMGKGVVQRSGRVVRFVAGSATPPNPEPPDGAKARVTVATVDETVAGNSLYVSPPERLSPVTRAKLEQIEFTENITTSNRVSDELEADLEGMPVVDKATSSDRAIPTASCNWVPLVSTTSTKPLDAQAQPPYQTLLESWLNRIATVSCADDCLNCLEALNSLPPAVTEQIWTSAEPLLAHFWSVASSETSPDGNEYQSGDSEQIEGSNCSIKESDSGAAENLASPTINDRLQHQTGQGHSQRQALGFKEGSNQGNSNNASSQHTSPHANSSDRIPIPRSPRANKRGSSAAGKVFDLVTGLWVRTIDGFYGHLGAKVSDGRWWVVSPASRTTDAQSRLYAAADIIPMPSA